MKNEVIYLDHNATTPVDPEVLEAMLPYFTKSYGNAASIDHIFGAEAKRAVETAREQISATINAYPEEVIFTSGATESDNIVLFGVAERYAEKGRHIITCVTEHKAVLDPCKRLEARGYEVTYLGVDHEGRINLDELESAIRSDTILISVMAANNEIGTLAPLEQIGRIAAARDVLFHSDASQALGQIPIDVRQMGIHMLSLSGHKIYGPKGIGVLYRKRSNPRVKLSPVIYGGGHELGLRSGTLNVPAIVGFGKAAEIALSRMESDARQYRELTYTLFTEMKRRNSTIEVNGPAIGFERLPNNLNVYIPGVESKSVIVKLKDIAAISAGSACTTASVEPSHVLTALGYGQDRAHQSIRVGVGRKSTRTSLDILSTYI
jgi:cysteine desulfurase